MNIKRTLPVTLAIFGCSCLWAAEEDDGEAGIRIGSRMTLSPYVSFGYTFDSNVDGAKREDETSSWVVNPGLTINYDHDNWGLAAAIFYSYRAYSSGHSKRLNNSSYGVSVAWNWQGEKGWSAAITESFSKILSDDDLTASDGKGLWRHRTQFNLNAAVNKQLSERLHAGVSAGTYWLDYDNDFRKYAPLYGWSSWTASANVGYTLTQWSDLFVSGSYSQHHQDNCDYLGGEGEHDRGNYVKSKSHLYSVHAGIQSVLTERLSYSVSAGWSGYEYGGVSRSNGFTYNGSLSWEINPTWNAVMGFTGTYQPAEREYGSALRSDAVNVTLNHTMIRDKLSANLSAHYRHEEHETVEWNDSDYLQDILTISLGLSYSINRYLSMYGNVGYQTSICDGNEAVADNYDFQRWQISCGFRLAY